MLVLGGTSEATALAHALAGRSHIGATLSLAGRTIAPAPQPLPTRIGGFGGADGLAAYLASEKIDVLIDATHPFAARISANARAAAAAAGCRLVVVGRPPWRPGPGDEWHEVDDIAGAVIALGPQPRRVFLTIGRQQVAAFAVAPHHAYLVRAVDPAEADVLPGACWIFARGPYDAAAEAALMREHRIDVLVTKNSGGDATRGKLVAAAELGVPVIMVRRPDAGQRTVNLNAALASIETLAKRDR